VIEFNTAAMRNFQSIACVFTFTSMQHHLTPGVSTPPKPMIGLHIAYPPISAKFISFPYFRSFYFLTSPQFDPGAFTHHALHVHVHARPKSKLILL